MIFRVYDVFLLHWMGDNIILILKVPGECLLVWTGGKIRLILRVRDGFLLLWTGGNSVLYCEFVTNACGLDRRYGPFAIEGW